MLLPLAFSSKSRTSQAPRNRVPAAAMSTLKRLWWRRMAWTRSAPSWMTKVVFSIPGMCQPWSGGTTTVAGSTQRRLT